jgi:hypothetical protein
MKNLAYKLAVIFTGTLLGFEIIFGFLFPKFVGSIEDSYLKRWRDFYTKKSGAELVCLGSSRIHRHCNPIVISEITKLRTETIAVGGAKIEFFERLYDDYLMRNPRPKVLVVGIDLTGVDSLPYTPFPEYFFPFIHLSDRISGMNEYNIIKYHKPLGYFYFKDIYTDMKLNPEIQNHIDGFLVRDIKWDSTLELVLGKNPRGYTLNMYEPTIEKIMKFIKREENAGVESVGIISPEYNEIWKYEMNRWDIIRKIYQVATKYNVRIINFADSLYKPCFNQAYFYNSHHLNKEGSTVFSRDLADSVVKYCLLKQPLRSM